MPGPGAPLPCPSRDDSPLFPWARRDAPRGSCNFPETSAGVWQTSASSCSARSRGGRAAEECVMGTLGACQVPAGAPPPLPARGRSGRTCAPAGPASPGRARSKAAGSGGTVANAAVRDWCQKRWGGRFPGWAPARAGVFSRGRRSLTFLGFAPDWGHREPPRDPNEWLVCCACHGNFSGIRCLRPGPSPFRSETCLPGTLKSLDDSRQLTRLAGPWVAQRRRCPGRCRSPGREAGRGVGGG